MSDNILASFNTDYALAQGECKNPELDSVNPAFRSKFASLAATRNAIVPVFTRHGFAIQQTPHTEMIGDRLHAGVHTYLRHKSGHVEDLGVCLMPVQKLDAQGIASCLTYAKRQSLQALACCTGEEDDDANAATDKPAAPLKAGIGVHSPLGETAASPEAQAYAEAFRKATTPDEVWQVHQDAHNEGEELYRATWALLDSKTRSSIKRIIEQRKVAA